MSTSNLATGGFSRSEFHGVSYLLIQIRYGDLTVFCSIRKCQSMILQQLSWIEPLRKGPVFFAGRVDLVGEHRILPFHCTLQENIFVCL
jgi:hypothetical protein